MNVNTIYNQLKIAKDFYYNGNPIMSDSEFDLLESKLREIDPNHQYFNLVGSPVRGTKIKHKNPMGSLTQMNEEELRDIFQVDEYIISEKLDGNSISLYYDKNGEFYQALTRGDGFEGLDITRHLKRFPDVSIPRICIPNSIVRGECILKKSLFNEDLGYKNPRNYVSGQLNSKEADDFFVENASFIAFDLQVFDKSISIDNLPICKSKQSDLQILNYYCFQTPLYQLESDGFANNLDFLLDKFRNISQFEIDGVVIEFNNYEKREELGFSGLNPNFSFKYKVNQNFMNTIVEDIIWSSSKDGYLKPRIKIEPVDLSGVTISYASGFNAKFILDNKIGKGSEIEITRSGDVIPHITKVISTPYNDYQTYFDEMLSDYNYHWSESKVDIILDEKDKTSLIKEIADFFSSINAPHLKIGNITKLFDNGFTSIESIILASKEDFEFIGENGKKIFDGLQKVLNPIDEYILAGSYPGFGRGIGKTRMKTLAEKFGTIYSLTYEDILSTDGFDDKTTISISSNLKKYKDFISRISHRVNIKYYEKKEGSLMNIAVCFTGVRSKSLEDIIKSKGGEITSSISKKTTHLVADNPSGNSTKLSKARKNNIIILSLPEAEELFNV